MPKFRVFSSDNIELAPCNANRAYSLVRKNKACLVVTSDQEIVLIINKSSEQLDRKAGADDER